MYSDEELTKFGFNSYHFGEPVEYAIVQANHREYETLTSGDLLGVKSIVDGRRILKPELFPGVTVLEIGVDSR
jgi:hypothetical protein